ncbi:MAG: PD-(D/E)XK nuclease family protein [Thermogutta sp.]
MARKYPSPGQFTKEQGASPAEAAPANTAKRIFLDWSRPAIQTLIEYLQAIVPVSPGDPPRWDLSGYRVVLPTSWATRRFLASLADIVADQKLILFPPEVITVGRLAETLYPYRRPLADDATSLLAWWAAIQELAYADESLLRRIIPGYSQKMKSSHQLALAQILFSFHRELFSAGYDCRAVLDAALKHDPHFPDRHRWEALIALEEYYQRILQGCGLWDIHFAQQEAVKNKECRTDKHILLVGLVDLPPVVRAMLRQLEEQVTVLVIAPANLRDHFDDLGCLIPEKWQKLPVVIPLEKITVCLQPIDQAEAIIDTLARWGERFTVEDITIGLPEEGLLPLVSEVLERYQLPSRFGPGQLVLRTPVWILIETIREFLIQPTAQAFAAILRHPQVEKWLRRHGDAKLDFLTQMDEWIAERLPLLMDAQTMAGETGPVKEIWETIWNLLQPEQWRKPQSPAAAGEIIRHLLTTFFGDPEDSDGLTQNPRTLESCRLILEAIQSWENIPEAIQKQLPWEATPLDILHWLEQQLLHSRIAAEPGKPGIELMGWLDLPWDDAAGAILTMVNEGYIPSAVKSDPFLPPRLRESLGINDNLRRFARDAYNLSLLVSSRKDYQLIAGRQNLEGDPLLPSRFLFAADDEVMVKQVREYFGLGTQPVRRRPPRWRSAAKHDEYLRRPSLAAIKPITEIRVTQFRDYLACPYRFYLRHILGIATVNDEVEELDPATFGSLAHQVLCDFARSKLRSSTDPDAIAEYLIGKLEWVVKHRFSAAPVPPLPIQIEQLKSRLRAFATFQAEHAKKWNILQAEYEPQKPVVLEVDEKPIRLLGRIDRIDQHRETGKFLILDYKVVETDNVTPEQNHRKKVAGERVWIDLQLPLYRLLAKELVEQAEVDLGYIVLPKNTEMTGLAVAEWTEKDLTEAEDVARDVVRNIWRNEFSPKDDNANLFPELIAILP